MTGREQLQVNTQGWNIQGNPLTIRENVQVIVSAAKYDFSADTRLLIPFVEFGKIGFVDKTGTIVVTPKYVAYYGDCYSENDFIIVAEFGATVYPRSDESFRTDFRPRFGIINYKGEAMLECLYRELYPAKGNNNLYTARNEHDHYGVLARDGTEIVSFGKYDWIGRFDKGLARVIVARNGNKQWGIIDETGREVLPVEYDSIWNFYDKPYTSIFVFKDGIKTSIRLNELL